MPKTLSVKHIRPDLSDCQSDCQSTIGKYSSEFCELIRVFAHGVLNQLEYPFESCCILTFAETKCGISAFVFGIDDDNGGQIHVVYVSGFTDVYDKNISIDSKH